MDIIILAAGRGERLLPMTRHTPKCLLEIGGGMTLLEAQLRNIDRVGVNKVFLVVGYLAEQIEAKLQSYLKDLNLTVEVVYNPFFDTSNNFMSMWIARPFMSDDFIVVNGDDIFHHSVLQDLKNNEHDVCMIIDKKDEYVEEDMKVRIKGECITEVSKKIPVSEGNGESIGMIRFRKNGAEYFIREIDKLVREPEGMNVFWLKAVQNLIDSGFCVKYHEIPQDHWAEVDFHPDLKAVQEQVFQYIPERLFKNEEE